MPEKLEGLVIGDVQESVDTEDGVGEVEEEESWTLDPAKASMGAEECESCSA